LNSKFVGHVAYYYFLALGVMDWDEVWVEGWGWGRLRFLFFWFLGCGGVRVFFLLQFFGYFLLELDTTIMLIFQLSLTLMINLLKIIPKIFQSLHQIILPMKLIQNNNKFFFIFLRYRYIHYLKCTFFRTWIIICMYFKLYCILDHLEM
jgi:hypothetical protein